MIGDKAPQRAVLIAEAIRDHPGHGDPSLAKDLLQIGASLTQLARYTIPGMGPCRNSPVGQTGL